VNDAPGGGRGGRKPPTRAELQARVQARRDAARATPPPPPAPPRRGRASAAARMRAAGAARAAERAKPKGPSVTSQKQSTVENQKRYNDITAHAMLSDNMAHLPVHAAAADRRAGQYFTAKQTATKNLVVPQGTTLVVAYTPLVVNGVTGYDPLPISYTVTPSNTPISGVGPLTADPSVNTTPNSLNTTLSAQADPSLGKVFGLLKGCMTVEVTNSMVADAMCAIQAIGLANLSVEPSLQARAVAATATNWYDATKDNLIAPFIAQAPLTTEIGSHASSYVPWQAARAAYVSAQPAIESRRGCSYYAGTPTGVHNGISAADTLGYNATGGALAPVILVRNRGISDLNVVITTHSVYAVPFSYTAATTLAAYAQDEAENVCLDEDVACSLSLGGIGANLLDSALAAKEAYLCALSRCRSGKPDHVRVAAAAALAAYHARKRDADSFIGVKIANPGEVHRTRPTSAEEAAREQLANMLAGIGSNIVMSVGEKASQGLFSLASGAVNRFLSRYGGS